MDASSKDVLKQLKAGKYKPVYFLMGEESFYIDEIAEFVENNALDESQKGFNQTILYGKDVKVVDILNQARRFPMVSERQTVIVREAQSINDLNRDTGQKLLINYLENPLDTTVLVFCHKNKSLDKRKGLYKALKKSSAIVVETKSLQESKIPAWIKERVEAKGLEITEKAVMMLTQNIGANMERINNEIEKVSLNVEGNSIDDSTIQTYVGISRDYNVFELQKALGARNIIKAHEIAQYLGENSKENPLVLVITLLFSFFTKILKLHSAKDKSNRALYGLLATSYIEDYKVAASNYPIPEVVRIIGEIRKADLQSKGIDSPSLSPKSILSELVSKIIR